MQNSTVRNLTEKVPITDTSYCCSKYLQYPKSQSNRQEGGLRLVQRYKEPLAGKPLVTVITVVYNGAKHINQCIRSVLEQTYDNIEYIVIDGASTDGTLEILRAHENEIDYFLSEPDSGIYAAMNKGLRLASGNYILLLNSDDWYEKTAIDELTQAAMLSGADVTHADAKEINKGGRTINILRGWLHDGIFTRGTPIRHETMLVRKDIYNKYGYYDESYAILADYVYIVNLYKGGCTFKHVTQPMLNFRNTGVSYMSEERRFTERARLFKEIFPFLDEKDLDVMKRRGRLSIDARLQLIHKHAGKSELFARSMAYNIADMAKEPETDWKYNADHYPGRYANLRAHMRKLFGINPR